jgi:hypothetical protein
MDSRKSIKLEMITILTKPPGIFNKEFIKGFVSRIVGKKRGPHAVLESLKRGLTELNVPFQVNPKRNQVSDTVHVLSGINSLKYAIELKKCGVIKKLIAGPNIVITPLDHDGIITDPNIDLIILPSEWTKDFFVSLSPTLSNKIQIWPAGVKIPAIKSEVKKENILIYKKDVPEGLFIEITKYLSERNIKFNVLKYGTYSQQTYFDTLQKSRLMIYLQKIESQGLAIQEAWAHDVPTLVWNNKSFTYPQGYTVSGNLSAPYLTNEAGRYFDDINNFKNIFDQFRSNLDTYNPRKYCIEKLSDKACAKQYASIISYL